jgi:hypothetical protein
MCQPRRLTTVWASTACYWDSFTFFWPLLSVPFRAPCTLHYFLEPLNHCLPQLWHNSISCPYSILHLSSVTCLRLKVYYVFCIQWFTFSTITADNTNVHLTGCLLLSLDINPSCGNQHSVPTELSLTHDHYIRIFSSYSSQISLLSFYFRQD